MTFGRLCRRWCRSSCRRRTSWKKSASGGRRWRNEFAELVVKADEAERSAAVRAELQRQGVAKLDLAYKAIRDEIHRGEDGKLIGMRRDAEHVEQFVKENPELLPARLGRRVGRGRGAEKRAGRDAGGFGDDSSGHESGGTGQSPKGDRQSGVVDAARVVEERENNGNNNFGKCSERDCKAGGGGRPAGVDGEPGNGEPGQSRL